MKLFLTLALICGMYSLFANAWMTAKLGSGTASKPMQPLKGANNGPSQVQPHAQGHPQSQGSSFSETMVEQKSLKFEDLIHLLLFQGQQNFSSVISSIETNDTVCDGQNTFYNFDLIPFQMRECFLKKIIKNNPNIDLDLTKPTNWASLSNQVQSLLIALTNSNGKYNFPYSLNACMSKAKLESTLCNNLNTFIDTYLQSQLNYVPATSSIQYLKK